MRMEMIGLNLHDCNGDVRVYTTLEGDDLGLSICGMTLGDLGLVSYFRSKLKIVAFTRRGFHPLDQHHPKGAPTSSKTFLEFGYIQPHGNVIAHASSPGPTVFDSSLFHLISIHTVHNKLRFNHVPPQTLLCRPLSSGTRFYTKAMLAYL